MPDILGALNAKRRVLRETRIALQTEFREKLAEIDAEISKVDSALNIVNDAVLQYLCPCCKGTGSVRRADAAGDMEDETCERCKGTGVDLEGK